MHKHGIFSIIHFPAMVAMGTGLCLNNALAVFEAMIGKKSEFIRTPKSGSSSVESRKGRYNVNANLISAYMEIILGLYCAYTFIFYFYAAQYFFGFFIAAYSIGLLIFGANTLLFIKHEEETLPKNLL